MKKAILTIICIAFAANVPAQITVGSLGQIGIGMPMGTNPQYPLDVAGNARVIGSIYLGNASGFMGTSGSFPLIFKVDNKIAGFTGNSADSNVSFGYGALNNPLAGSGNIALGYNALYSNTTGRNNTVLGTHSLPSNTIGNNNVAIGAGALAYNVDGSNNIAIGFLALNFNWNGNGNTAIGINALWTNDSGHNNTAIGNSAGVNDYNLSNTIAIGYQAKATTSNQVSIGNNSVTKIGGYVNWTNFSDGRAKRNIAADIPGLNFINRLQPVSYNLDLKVIDELIKSDDPKINAHRDSLQAAMSPEERRITEEARANKESKVYSGFVAQDVEKAAKETGYDFSGVDAPDNGKGPYGLRYAEFVVPLVKAVQELGEQNDALQQTVKEQQITIDKMKQQIEKLENR